MKLIYKILWFEDDEEVIELYQAPNIKKFLTELGFEPVITPKTNAEDLDELMKSHVINSYDLIISDYNLDDTNEEEVRGNEIIKRLRDGLIMTEVLLYSSKPGFLQEVIDKQGWVERASYCVGRPNLEQKIKDIILLTVRKQQDVNNTRGLVIAETILLEHKISSILFDYFEATAETVPDTDKMSLLEDIKQKRLAYSQEHVDFLNQVANINLQELIDRGILTANNTLEALSSVLKQRGAAIGRRLNETISGEERDDLTAQQQGIKSLRDEMKLFKTEIIDIRNILAHVVESADSDGVPYLESRMRNVPPVKFDANRYVQIRKDLHKHGHNLDEIKKHLAEQQ